MADKNNDQSTQSISNQAIIVICLAGSGFFLLCAYAAGRFYSPKPPDAIVDREGNDGMTQSQYMRMVRIRNTEELQRTYGGYGRPKPVTMSSYDSAV